MPECLAACPGIEQGGSFHYYDCGCCYKHWNACSWRECHDPKHGGDGAAGDATMAQITAAFDTTTAVRTAGCAPGYSLPSGGHGGGRCFRYSGGGDRRDWRAARRACQDDDAALGTDLATVGAAFEDA